MHRFGRASAIGAAVGFSLLVSGCVHEGLNTVVGSNGTAQLVITETISPVVYDSTGLVGGLTPAKLAMEERKTKAGRAYRCAVPFTH